MPIRTIAIQKCIRRVKGIRCNIPANLFCKNHIHDKCAVCSKQACFECRKCDTPLCATCQHHDSFGY